MTKKRFTDDGIEEIENQSFTDNLTGKTYWIDNGLDEIIDLLNALNDENEQLKQKVTHLTMYKKLFREFQKQLDGVKKKSDLDHKDFEDLIELTNGHVFDDVYGWIWLPVNDR